MFNFGQIITLGAIKISAQIKQRCLLIMLFALIAVQGHSGHIIGGELFYDCLGGGNFRITLRMYRNCFSSGTTGAPFDNPATVSVFRTNSGQWIEDIQLNLPAEGSFAVNPNTINPCYAAPPEVASLVCIEGVVYQEIVNLPFDPGGLTLAYQRCCRPANIVNIQNPSQVGATYTIDIPGSAWNICNSSPRYNNLPPIILCQNLLTSFDNSATDPDGDQLVYSLCNPYDGGTFNAPMPVPAAPPPYSNAPFITPTYSATAPMLSNPPITINATTGLIDLSPTQLGWHVVAFCVSEYRNGVLLSVNKRDFQLLVIAGPCEPYTIDASILLPSGALVDASNTTCSGLEFEFVPELTNTQVDLQNLPSPNFLWDFGVENTTSDFSTQLQPTFIFPTEGNYTVTLTMYPESNCPSTSQVNLSVYNPIDLAIISDDDQCVSDNSFDFSPSGDFELPATFNWTFSGSASQTASNQQNPIDISWPEPGTYIVTLDVNDPHCSDQAQKTITVHPPLSVSFSADPVHCAPARVFFDNASQFSPGAEFLWEFGDSTTSSLEEPRHVYSEPGVYDVALTVYNSIGCVDTQRVELPQLIQVNPSPTALLVADTTYQSFLTPEIVFTDLSENFTNTWLYPGDGSLLENPSGPYRYTRPGNFNAILIAENEFGCIDSSLLKITIEPYFAVFIPNAFTPNGDGINDTYGPIVQGAKQYRMRIYDRWGHLAFESTDLNERWDGRILSSRDIAPDGVFTMVLDILDYELNEHRYYEKVVLLK